MFSIDCKKCDGRCCTSRNRKLYVVLTPQEKDNFKSFSTTLETVHGVLPVLRKSEAGDCIFYDPIKNLCNSYQNRPFECRMYPLIIHYNEDVKFVFDYAVCAQVKEQACCEIEEMKQKWLDQKLPLDWIKAYSTIA